MSLFIASLGDNYSGGRKRSVRSVRLSNREVKVLVRQFAKNVRELRSILFKQGFFRKILQLELLLLSEADCVTINNELGEIYDLMESNNLNSLLSTTFSIKLSLLEDIESLIASKFSFRFWRMLPVWLRNIEKVMYSYGVIGSAGR